jgi:molecular chaperone DnaK (HSP70)
LSSTQLKTNYSNTIRAPQRLLGLENHPHLLEEELKYSGLKYTCSQDIDFIVQGQQGSVTVSAEEICVSLVNKVKQIAESHQLQVSLPYISVPTYYPQEARHALLHCA